MNILKYYGTKLDVKIDNSELYDYELSKIQDDYNKDILETTVPIQYDTLKIDDSLLNFECVKNTITLIEYDNRVNDSEYPYSGYTVTLTYDNFVDWISVTHKYEILNNNTYVFVDDEGNDHYLKISNYNEDLSIDVRMGNDETEIIEKFTPEIYLKCVDKLEDEIMCCEITPKYNVKPWAYQFIEPEENNCESPIIERRVEKGWTIDFIFNRESLPWSDGGKFYYFGVGGSETEENTGDNMLSFGFTEDGEIEWTVTRYSGYCDTESGYTETYYVDSDTTPILCTTGDTKDFNVTIVFNRYNQYEGCDLANKGGWNDLLGWKISEYEDLDVTAVTSNQITTYEVTDEFLNQVWNDSKNERLGTLKIYLNGNPIYKKDNWEEIVPSNRGSLPFIQSWGGSLQSDVNHNGVSCFNIKSIKYYEEPLDFLYVKHNFLTRIDDYDFFICGHNNDCQDDIVGYYPSGITTEDEDFIITDDNDIIIS